MKTRVKVKKTETPTTETPEEVIVLFEELDILNDLFEKYEIDYDNTGYQYKRIDPVIYKKYEKEIVSYKNKLVRFLGLIIDDNGIKEYEEVHIYDLKHIVCDFTHIIYRRCEEVENLVLKSAELSLEYIEQVIEGKWEEFEQNIPNYPDTKENASLLYRYCKDYGTPSKEAENKIKNHPEIAYYYAISVKKERWPEAEKTMLRDIERASDYVKELGIRWPEYENKIRNKPKRIYEYAMYVIKGKLPDELHNRMMMRALNDEDKGHHESVAYFDWLKGCEEDAVSYMKSISEEERKSLLAKI